MRSWVLGLGCDGSICRNSGSRLPDGQISSNTIYPAAARIGSPVARQKYSAFSFTVLETSTCHRHAFILWCFAEHLHCSLVSVFHAEAFLQATSRVPRWWIGERPPDMAASCDIYK